MAKSSTKKLENPGLTSTMWIEPQYIADMAKSFSDVALGLTISMTNPHDVQWNTFYTNAVFAIELYFKAYLVKRFADPAYFDPDNGEIKEITEEEQWTHSGVTVSFGHSILAVPADKQSHDVRELFDLLPNGIKEQVVNEVTKETPLIKNIDELRGFLSEISGFFVKKRYNYEYYIESVPKDSNCVYRLLPVLSAISKALAHPPPIHYQDSVF